MGWETIDFENAKTRAATPGSFTAFEKDHVITVILKNSNAESPVLVLVGYFGNKKADEPGEVIWCPVTEKGIDSYFHHRIHLNWKTGDFKYMTKPYEVQEYFNGNIDASKNKIKTIRRIRFDPHFRNAVKAFLALNDLEID